MPFLRLVLCWGYARVQFCGCIGPIYLWTNTVPYYEAEHSWCSKSTYPKLLRGQFMRQIRPTNPQRDTNPQSTRGTCSCLVGFTLQDVYTWRWPTRSKCLVYLHSKEKHDLRFWHRCTTENHWVSGLHVSQSLGKQCYIKCQIWGFHRGHYEKCRMASSGMLRRVALVRTDVSEELSASFIRVTRIGELGAMLAVTSNRFLSTWWRRG
jgi:hypothetical protein